MTIKDHIEALKLTASHDHAACGPIIKAKDAMDPKLVSTWEAGRACGFHAGWDEGFRAPGKVLRMIRELFKAKL